MKTSLYLLLAAFSIIGISSTSHGQGLLLNGDFENGTADWSLFAPANAQQAECKFTTTDQVHLGNGAGLLSSTSEARYGIVTTPKGVTFGEGVRYRVSAWVKADENFVVKPGTPGFIIRVTLFADKGTNDVPGGHYYFGLENKVVHGYDTTPFVGLEIPKNWTKIEGVFALPAETAALNVAVFVWSGTGRIYIDDMSFEQVDSSVPLSEISTPKN